MRLSYLTISLGAALLLLIGASVLLYQHKTTPFQLLEVSLSPARLAQQYEILDTSLSSESALKKLTLNPTPSPTPTPTPKPTFAQLNAMYGPCTIVPTLMYHHIQPLDIAAQYNQTSLSVDPTVFRGHMQYLQDKGYSVITMKDLISFFTQEAALPAKSVLLTFDDGYDDFATNAAPILNEFHFPATMFLSTGLMENAGYLSWSAVTSIAGAQPILMANHTWSHHNMQTTRETIEKEIITAKQQLADRGLDTPKTFAYPYGLVSETAKNVLFAQGYEVGFTTEHGSTLCKQQRLTLPRIRVGNSALSAYGL